MARLNVTAASISAATMFDVKHEFCLLRRSSPPHRELLPHPFILMEKNGRNKTGQGMLTGTR